MTNEKIIYVKEYERKCELPDADYVINPYVGCTHGCAYCYAEFMRRFSNHREPWGKFVDIKLCERKISHMRLNNKTVMLSSVTDPYNHFEKKYEVTRDILKQLSKMNLTLNIMTKSDMILRDLDILKEFNNIQVIFSFSTVDENIRQIFEHAAPSVKRRLNALKTLHDEGITTAVFLSPILPGITDYKKIVEASRDFADEFWFENLNLREGYKKEMMTLIKEKFPALYPLYEDIYKLYKEDYWQELEQDIENYSTENRLMFQNRFFHNKKRKRI